MTKTQFMPHEQILVNLAYANPNLSAITPDANVKSRWLAGRAATIIRGLTCGTVNLKIQNPEHVRLATPQIVSSLFAAHIVPPTPDFRPIQDRVIEKAVANYNMIAKGSHMPSLKLDELKAKVAQVKAMRDALKAPNEPAEPAPAPQSEATKPKRKRQSEIEWLRENSKSIR